MCMKRVNRVRPDTVNRNNYGQNVYRHFRKFSRTLPDNVSIILQANATAIADNSNGHRKIRSANTDV